MRFVHIHFESNPLGFLLEDSVPDTARLLHPVCHAERSSHLTYGTYNGRIGSSLTFLSDIATMFRHQLLRQS